MAAMMLTTIAATTILTLLPFTAALQRDDNCLKKATDSLMCEDYYAGKSEVSFFCCLDFKSIVNESPLCTCMLDNYNPPKGLQEKYKKLRQMVKRCNFSPQLQPSPDCYAAAAPLAPSAGGAQLGKQETNPAKRDLPHPDKNDFSQYFPKLEFQAGALPSSLQNFFKNTFPTKGLSHFDFTKYTKDFGAPKPAVTYKPYSTYTNHGRQGSNAGSFLKPISIPVMFSVVIVLANLLIFPYFFVGL